MAHGCECCFLLAVIVIIVIVILTVCWRPGAGWGVSRARLEEWSGGTTPGVHGGHRASSGKQQGKCLSFLLLSSLCHGLYSVRQGHIDWNYSYTDGAPTWRSLTLWSPCCTCHQMVYDHRHLKMFITHSRFCKVAFPGLCVFIRNSLLQTPNAACFSLNPPFVSKNKDQIMNQYNPGIKSAISQRSGGRRGGDWGNFVDQVPVGVADVQSCGTKAITGGSCHKYHFCRDKSFVVTNTGHVFCHNKNMLVATKLCLSQQNVFGTTSILLSWQKTCIVMTNTCLSWQK